jgi:GDPmannose 4,6-dehydratase
MKALISGITGQDGSYLAEYLLSKGYEVHGLIRRAGTCNTSRLDSIFVDPHIENAKLLLHYGDLADSQTLSDVVYNLKPDEVYHLGAQSHVRISFDIPEYTANITALGTIRILDVIRRSGNKIKFYQASSSEMFGDTPPPQNENTPFKPRSPYAAAKVFAYWLTEMYRNGYGVLSCNGILFNHESPRRGETFVTRKITMAIANILAKNQDVLYLGNLEAKRDWGYAPEYVEMMWKMLKKKKYENFVVGTGESHSVREFLNEAFAYTDLKYDKYVKIDPKYFRPTDTEHLVADNKKVQTALNWTPKISFKELVRIMVDADMRKTGINPIGEGDEILKKKFPNKWWKGD